MKTFQTKEGALKIATAALLLSILLMIIILPSVYTKTLPNENNLAAVIGISLAIVFRLPIIIWYKYITKKVKRGKGKRKTGYILIGIFLTLLGLIYSDGAFAFSNNKDIQYVSYLMFTSVFCELVAVILTFVAAFFKIKIN